jgi:uncharacterized membrane protein
MSGPEHDKKLSKIFLRAVNSIFCGGRERLTRSFVKNVSWRSIAFVDTAAISYIYTGNAAVAGTIALAEIFTASALFMVHEQTWGRVSWGLEKKPAQTSNKKPQPDTNPSAQDTSSQTPDSIATESKKRSMARTLTWRALASSDTFLLGLLMTGGDVNTATKIAVTEVVTKIFLFYLHERAWNRTQFGINKPAALPIQKEDETNAARPFF